MNATQETEFYRREGEQQARDRWNKKGAKLTPATCDRLAAAMVRWAEKRCAAVDTKLKEQM